MALVCVHGTYSKDNALGDSLDKLTTHHLINLAQMLGVSYKRVVHLITFVWSGQLDTVARQQAGGHLANYLIRRKGEFDALWTVAHSHGCNVVNWAAYHMLKQGYELPIDTAIHFASRVKAMPNE